MLSISQEQLVKIKDVCTYLAYHIDDPTTNASKVMNKIRKILRNEDICLWCFQESDNAIIAYVLMKQSFPCMPVRLETKIDEILTCYQ